MSFRIINQARSSVIQTAAQNLPGGHGLQGLVGGVGVTVNLTHRPNLQICPLGQSFRQVGRIGVVETGGPLIVRALVSSCALIKIRAIKKKMILIK